MGGMCSIGVEQRLIFISANLTEAPVEEPEISEEEQILVAV